MYIAKQITKENINVLGQVFKTPGTKISEDMIGWYIIGDPYTFVTNRFSLIGLYDAKSFAESFEILEYTQRDGWMKCKVRPSAAMISPVKKNTTCKCKNKGDKD